jgi:hypothetical protein
MGRLQEINKKGGRFTLVIDEIQSLRLSLSAELRSLVAYSCDSLEEISVIISRL